MIRPKVYISGPITLGNRNDNFHQAVEAERKLMLDGFSPLNPMRSMTLPFAWEKEYTHELWLACDMPWVESADAILRLPGLSDGAAKECQRAADLGIPVLSSIKELQDWRDNQWDESKQQESEQSAGEKKHRSRPARRHSRRRKETERRPSSRRGRRNNHR